MIRALLWKELREHQWKLLTLALIPLLSLLFAKDDTDYQIHLTLAVMLAWVLPIWIAALTVTSESSPTRTGMIFALPVHSAVPWLIKSLFGIATFILPATLFWIVIHMIVPLPEDSLDFLCMLVGITQLYLMIAALTMGVRHQIRAVMFGLLITLATFFLSFLCFDSSPRNEAWMPLLAIFPLGSLMTRAPFLTKSFTPYVLGIQLAVCALWWLIAAHRFAAPAKRARGKPATTSPTAKPRQINYFNLPQAALLWRESREQILIVICSGIAGILIAAIIAVTDTLYSSERYRDLAHAAEIFTLAVHFIGLVIPSLVTLVLGVGAWAPDLEPRLHDFWRSRPILPASMFWSKLALSAAGISALLLSYAGIVALGALLFPPSSTFVGSDDINVRTVLPRILAAQILWLPFVFSVSLLATFLIRHVLYAAILAIVAVLAAGLCPVNRAHDFVLDRLFNTNFPLEDAAPLIILLILLTSLMLTTARLAAQHNWRLTKA